MKARLLRGNRPKQGAAPGTLVAPEGAMQPGIHVFAFDADALEEKDLSSPQDIKPYLKKWPLIWINVNGLGDTNVIAELGEMFNIHPLAQEDVLTIPQRAKLEEFEENFFLIMRMVKEEQDAPSLEQLSIFWGEGYVLTFQERPGDVFAGVRERLRKGAKRLRASAADYMAYALIDAVIDGYFPVLELFSDRLDELEDIILNDPGQESMAQIHKTKRELQALRLCIWPVRESLSKIHADSDIVAEETLPFFRDCQDHVIQVLDIVENYRERVSSLTDLYLSSISNKMNEVMKVLTIIATIFMPLGFLAGIYGMNFDTGSPYNMPELAFRFGYPVLLSVMVLVAIGMLLYFRSLGWLGNKKEKD